MSTIIKLTRSICRWVSIIPHISFIGTAPQQHSSNPQEDKNYPCNSFFHPMTLPPYSPKSKSLHSRYPTFSTLMRHIESIIVSSHGRANSKVHPRTYHSFSECQSSPIPGAVKSSNLHTYAGSKPDSYKTSVLPVFAAPKRSILYL